MNFKSKSIANEDKDPPYGANIRKLLWKSYVYGSLRKRRAACQRVSEMERRKRAKKPRLERQMHVSSMTQWWSWGRDCQREG